MSKIPYLFETPVPRYFRETGWFENEHMFKFVTWAFSKCQNVSHKEIIYGKEIILEPFEFIAGRLSSPKECFLSENIFRNQINQLLTNGILVRSTNSLTNKYSAYIWVTAKFSKMHNQQNNQQITNRQPTDNHKERIENIDIKEDISKDISKKILPLPEFSSDQEIQTFDDVLVNDCEQGNITYIISSKKETKLELNDSNLKQCTELSELLLNNILKINPKNKLPNLKNWATHIDDLIRIDQRSPEEIRKILEWIDGNSFWRSNVLSTKKLREKFDQIWIIKTEEEKKQNRSTYANPKTIDQQQGSLSAGEPRFQAHPSRVHEF